MYSLIARQKWYIQVAITIVLMALTITGYLFARSAGYDKARAKFEAEDKVKAEKSTQLIARAEALERRVAELEPKLAAFEKLDDEKKRLDGTITEKIDAVIQKGIEDAKNIDAPSDCWTRAHDTCARLARLQPPININCEEYKQRLCAAGGAGAPCPK